MLRFVSGIFSKDNGDADLRNMDPVNVRNILIVRQHNQLGDMLCSVPLFAAVRKKFPSAHITLVASPINYEILYSDINPYIDKVITYRKTPLKNLIEFYRELKNHEYQIGIVPSTVSISRTSHLINFFSGAKVRVGVRRIDDKENNVEYLLNVKSDFNWDARKLHQVDRNLEVGNQIGCSLTKLERSNVRIHISEEEQRFANEFIERHFAENERPLVSIHPGAGKAANRWNKDKFVELVKRLHIKFNCHVLITSGSIDTDITKYIADKLDQTGIETVVLENTPIRKVGAVIKLTDLYITNDTGTMHVAGGVNANVISLFGPTHGYEWAPEGENKIFIQSPTSDINDISVDSVFETSSSMLISRTEKLKVNN